MTVYYIPRPFSKSSYFYRFPKIKQLPTGTAPALCHSIQRKSVSNSKSDLSEGKIEIQAELHDNLFWEILSDQVGVEIATPASINA